MLVAWQHVGLERVRHHSKLIADFLDFYLDLKFIVLSEDLGLVDRDHQLVVEEVPLYRRFEISQVIEAKRSDRSAEDQDLVVGRRAHLGDF